jgi:hypothetical protein
MSDALGVLIAYRRHIATILDADKLRFEDPLQPRDPQLEALLSRHRWRFADTGQAVDFVVNMRVLELVSGLESFRRPVLQACGQLGVGTAFIDAIPLALQKLADIPPAGAQRKRGPWAALRGIEQPLRALDDLIALAQGQAARQEEARPAAAGRDPPAVPPPPPVLPSVDDEDLSILLALHSRGGRLTSQGQIAAAARRPAVSRGTVSYRLPRLENLELVERPKGPRGGYVLTPKGAQVLAAHGLI